jgi:hypothetical protein
MMAHLFARCRRACRAGALLLLLVATGGGTLQAQELRTAPEVSGFERFTTYDEMMDFLVGLRARSPDMRLGSYGDRGRDGSCRTPS